MKNDKLKNWSVEIFYFTFGQLDYWSEPAKEANLKESDSNNHIVLIQSSNGSVFTKCISLFAND